MKTIVLLAIEMSFSLMMQAQVSKNTDVTAGNLGTIITATELSTITNLTLTGTIDARDFETIKNQMPLLAELDISETTVTSYDGTEGTYYGSYYSYPANAIPDNAFYDPSTGIGRTSLISVLLPSSIASIRLSAFMGCSGLTSITIPSSVTSIEKYAFYTCGGLKSVTIPSSVTSIGEGAFYGCYGLTSITFPSIDALAPGVLQSCTGLTSFTIPSSVTSIGFNAFWGCSNLTSITIPSSVTSIGSNAFLYCSGLTSIFALGVTPVDLSSSSSVFDGVDKTSCTLNVPIGTLELYTAADQWKDFTNIVEIPLFKLSSPVVNLAADAGSTALVTITSDVAWSVTYDANWLNVSPVSFTGDNTLTFTAETNSSDVARIAQVTISSGVFSKTINVCQTGPVKTVYSAAGFLSSTLTVEDLDIITKLVIIGTIDARDFETMKDKMPLLAELDISGVTVAAYNGTEGTNYGSYYSYLANAIPDNAFYNPSTGIGKKSLISVILPSSITSIQLSAFMGCSGLTSITIPSSVTSVEKYAFYTCGGLKSVIIPSSVTSIGEGAFCGCYSLTSITFPSIDALAPGVLQACSGLTSFTIPSSVTSIGFNAFWGCSNLTSIVIPSAVTSIGSNAFLYCYGLTSIFTLGVTPVDLSSSTSVFDGVDKNYCTLYVPCGSVELYTAADRWKDFTHIVDLPADTGPISGAYTVCQGQNSVVYSIPPIPNATSYIWSLPSEATGTSTTNGIMVNYGNYAISGNITVKGTNSCGDGASSTLAVTVNPLPSTPVVTLTDNVLHSDAASGNQWYNQSGLIYGAINQDYTATTGGDYYVIVTLNGCASDLSNSLNVIITGIELPGKNMQVEVYPNPVTDELIIDKSGNTKKMKFEIITSSGKVVYNGALVEKTTVQMSGFSKGFYILRIENEAIYVFRKIIKD